MLGAIVGGRDASTPHPIGEVEPAAPRLGRRGWRAPGWAAVAVVLVGVGIVGSAFAAHGVARNAATSSRRAFRASTAEIAGTLRLAIQHEQDLIVGASGFVVGDPTASNTQFVAWARSVHTLASYPELIGFDHAVIVPAAGLSGFAARAVKHPAGRLAAHGTFKVVPSGRHAFYCLATGSLWRPGAGALPAGYDFCAGASGESASLASRGFGQGVYMSIRSGGTTLLSTLTPIYRGGVLLDSLAARRGAFLGWIGMSIEPERLLAPALRGHPDTAVTLRYQSGSLAAVFRSGTAPRNASSTTVALGNGWTLEAFGVVAGAGVGADTAALALLTGGIVLSGLLAGLLFILGAGRARARWLVGERTSELHYQAFHDRLTGLPNRTLILDRIEQLLARGRRLRTEGAALYVDLDEFKNVNDSLGHGAGDHLLVAVAARLTRALREADTIGRLGGDEFVVLIDGGELAIAPELVAERLLDVMRQPFQLEETAMPLIVNASIGIAVGDRASAGELLRDADVALYQAKAAGKNRYQTFSLDLEGNSGRRAELEFDLRSALEGEQFRLVYQPIYRLDDLSLVGVEALLRWQHPTRGLVQPDEFIPILEQSGQIREVGRWVMHKACEQMAAWHARGDTIDVSVNVSAAQLDSDAIVDHLCGALAISGLPAASLIIEVTETALMGNAEATARRLQAINDLGVRIAVDDFGTGYSSLAYLQQLPVDCLKIDRMFTNAITSAPESKALIGTLVQLGKDLGLKTLAEGVETPGQLEHLRADEVDEIQGYLLSRPLDPHALEERILAPSRPAALASRRR